MIIAFFTGFAVGVGSLMALRVILYRLNLEAHHRKIQQIEKQLEQWQN